MRHLFRSKVEVLTSNPRMKPGAGVAELRWDRDDHMFDPYLGQVGLMMCRLDLSFIRVGKDAPSALVAGRAPDRVGVMFFTYTPYLKAGHKIRCIEGPIKGTFELRQAPDEAQDYVGVHHGEVGIIETSQMLNGNFPNQESSPHVERP